MLFGIDLGIDTRIILNLIMLLLPLTLSILSVSEKSYLMAVISGMMYFFFGFTMYFILATPELAR